MDRTFCCVVKSCVLISIAMKNSPNLLFCLSMDMYLGVFLYSVVLIVLWLITEIRSAGLAKK